jgi:hypothetical protein
MSAAFSRSGSALSAIAASRIPGEDKLLVRRSVDAPTQVRVGAIEVGPRFTALPTRGLIAWQFLSAMDGSADYAAIQSIPI